MKRSDTYWILFLTFVCLIDSVRNLRCYTCLEQIENWKCNEKEPVKCERDQVCTTSGGKVFSKQCMDKCPSSRGDSVEGLCHECKTNFCNVNNPDNSDIAPNAIVPNHTAMAPNGTKYILFAEASTYWEARARCSKGGGVLANIHTKEVQDFINENFLRDSHAGGMMEASPPHSREFGYDEPFSDGSIGWIGLYYNKVTRRGSFEWMWMDNGNIISNPNDQPADMRKPYEVHETLVTYKGNTDATPSSYLRFLKLYFSHGPTEKYKTQIMELSGKCSLVCNYFAPVGHDAAQGRVHPVMLTRDFPDNANALSQSIGKVIGGIDKNEKY